MQALTDNISRLKDRDGDDRSDDGAAPPRIDCSSSALDGMQQFERDDDRRLKDGGRVRKASKAHSKGKKTLRGPQVTTTTTSSSAASSLPTQTMAMNLDKLLSEAYRCNTSEEATLRTEVETAIDGSQVLHITVPIKHDTGGSSGGKQSSSGSKKKKNGGSSSSSGLTARDASSGLNTQSSSSSSCVTSADPVWSRTSAANTCQTESSVSISGRDRKVVASRQVAAAKGQAAAATKGPAVTGGDPPAVWEMHLSKNGRPFFHNNM